MAEHGYSLSDKIARNIHDHDSSSSDSDDDEPSHLHDYRTKICRLFGRERPLHKVFGGGKSADVFLWRDKKVSAGILGGATAIWVLFEMLEYHLVTLVCYTLILSLAVMFLWANASTFINRSPPQISGIVLPEKCVLEAASALILEINHALAVARDIASGKDLKIFLGIVAGLWVLSVVGNWFNFLTFFYIVFVLLLIVPVVYEKNEDQVDAFAEKALIQIKKQYAVLDMKVLSKIPRGPLKDKKRE